MSEMQLRRLHSGLQQLEPLARALDPDPATYAEDLAKLAEFARAFLEGIPQRDAWQTIEPPTVLREPVPDGPGSFTQVLEEFRRFVLPGGVQPTSGRFLGYVPGGALPSAAVGDFLAALTNKYSGVYYASPGAAEVENATLRWMREIVGYPTEAWGTLQSGGSLATLTAVVTARETRPMESWTKGALYATSEAHLAIEKAIHIAGLGCLARRTVAVDKEFRLRIPDLERQIAEDRAQGLEPWMVFATAGTTNTGAIDPLAEIAALSRRERLWLHVDAAYGGFFILCKRTRGALAAMSEADSLVLDPHKGLFLPYGCGAVLVRDGERLRRSLSFHSDYLPPKEMGEERSPADYSTELTRHFRGLRLWFSLKTHGLERFRAALEEKLLLAELAHEELSRLEEVEVGPAPQLSCAVFRLRGSDERTERLHQAILKSGRVFLSPTRLNRKLYLRICVLCFRSHREDVEAALNEIRRCIDA